MMYSAVLMLLQGTALHILDTPKRVSPITELPLFPSKSTYIQNFSSRVDLVSNMVVPGSPFVVRNAIGAMNFSDQFLNESLGESIVPAIETARKETRKTGNLFGSMTWSEFLSVYKDADIYLVSQVPPALRHLVSIPGLLLCPLTVDPLACAELDTPVLWLAGNTTQSVIHSDADDNFHCLIDGHKEFLLWSPDNRIETLEFGWTTDDPTKGYGSFAGEIDPEFLDAEKFPGWLDLEAQRTVLEAGDCLYLPMRWVHYVRSGNQRTLSYHVWFRPGIEHDLQSEELFPVSSCIFHDDIFRFGWPKHGRFSADVSSLCSL